MIYGLGELLSRAVSFIMIPVYTRFLTPGDYGVMALIEMSLEFIAIMGGARLALGVFRFYHKADSEEDRREIASTAFLLIGALYVVIATVVFLCASMLSNLLFGGEENAILIRLAAGNLAASSLLIVPLSLARVKDFSTFYVGASVVKLTLVLSLNILFIVVMGLGVMGIFLGGLIANSIVGGFLAVWLIRTNGAKVSRAWIKDLTRYGIPLMASEVATFLATFSDRFFIQAVADESVVGLYNLAYQFGFLLVMVGVTPMFMVWGPKRFQVAREENRDELLSHGFLIMSVLMITTAVGISLYVGDVLRIMATSEFHPAADVVPVILVAYVLKSWANALDIGILVQEKTRFLAIANWISMAVAVIGYALLIPRYVEWGAAFATVLSMATRFGLTYGFSQMLWPVRYDWRPVIVLSVWASMIAGVGFVMPPIGILQSLGLRTGLVAVFFAGLWFLPILSASDRRTAVSFAGEALGWLKARRTRG